MAQVRDGRKRQTFVYDVHGKEQGALSIASGDVQSWDKADKHHSKLRSIRQAQIFRMDTLASGVRSAVAIVMLREP
jgi:hypothetical protein